MNNNLIIVVQRRPNLEHQFDDPIQVMVPNQHDDDVVDVRCGVQHDDDGDVGSE